MNNFKVLMALMGLEIGGAETHVLELCKALRKEGVDVYVASNGGAYEAELKQWGVRHFHVPLHNKHVGNLVSAYRALRRIIIEHDIKLVHAHARIPAFLCGLLQKNLNIRFVTTAHGTFTTSFPFNILTNWGERSLAVSQDVGQYLVKNYGIQKERVTLTINGIDTDKFSPEIVYADVMQEFDIREDTRRIVFVSRMDRYKSVVAHKLLEAIPIIAERYPEIEVVMVGDGESFAKVQEAARGLNRRMGRSIVKMCGARIDINKFVACADVFVGVSRCALEAMAGERAVVLAGEEGYLGIFNEDVVEKGIATNFTCRGCEATSTAALAEDICRIIEMPISEREALGKLGRELVLGRYSTSRMAVDALSLYNLVRMPPDNRDIDVLISGYYGFGNNGDDAVLQSIVESLRRERPELRIVVLSKNPQDTEERYGVDSIFRFNFAKVCKYLRRTRLLITGGGTLLQDLTSTQSLLYYLWVINTAVRSGARTMLYANGIGPIRYEANKERVAAVLRRLDTITLRDERSLEELSKFEVGCEVALTADAAFGLQSFSEERQAEVLSTLGLLEGSYFVVSVRSWKYMGRGFEDEMISFARAVQEEHGIVPLFISMQPDNDAEISRRIYSRVSCAKILDRALDTEQYVGIIGGAVFVVAMRLHAIIYGAKTGTPCIGLVYDPKVRAMMEAMGQATFATVEDTNHQDLLAFARHIVSNRKKISEEILQRIAPLTSLSQENTKYAIELLDRPLF